MKHTQGKWRIAFDLDQTYITSDNGDICYINEFRDRSPYKHEEARANAELIVTAPQMHSQLTRIKEFFEDNIGWIESRARDGDEGCFILLNEMNHLLRLIKEEEK